MSKYNAQQLKVVTFKEGSMLVLSPPGSGKTFAIVGRANNLINAGIPGDCILMLTYSRQAAMEMGNRIGGDRDCAPTTSTFHAFGYKIIRENPFHFNRRRGVRMMDENDCGYMLRRILAKFSDAIHRSMFHHKDVGDKRRRTDDRMVGLLTAGNYYALYASARYESLLNGIPIANHVAKHGDGKFDEKTIAAIVKVFATYEEYKLKDNLVDFDDAIFRTVKALRVVPELKKSLSDKYQYIMGDEAQDMDSLQMEMVEQIGSHGNIVLVGDDDQTIHEHRGADPSLLTSFRDKYNATTVSFEQNYRSPPGVVAPAALLIENNKRRISKNFYSALARGSYDPSSGISNSSHGTHDEMLSKMYSNIANAMRSDEGSFKDHVVLYRTNAMAQFIKREFTKSKIEFCTMADGTRDKNPRQLMVFIWLVKLAIDERDTRSFFEIARAFGISNELLYKTIAEMNRAKEGTLRHICKNSRFKKISSFGETLWPVVDRMMSQEPLDGFAYLCSNFLYKHTVERFYKRVLNRSMTAKDEESEIQVIQQIRERISAFLNLEHIGILSVIDQYYSIQDDQFMSQEWDSGNPHGVCLGTMHASKGREFKHVHIICASEGFSPYYTKSHPLNERALESERRLFYVAVTRAMVTAHIYHSWSYPFTGRPLYRELQQSRFVRELNLN